MYRKCQKLCLRSPRSKQMIRIVILAFITICIFFKAQSGISPAVISAINAFFIPKVCSVKWEFILGTK